MAGAGYSHMINSFAAGELSRIMDGRTDHEKYYSGCRRLENFIPKPHGAAYRRPGLRFCVEVKDSGKFTRIIPFDYNSELTQAYVIELGEGYMRFCWGGGQVLDGGTPYEIEAPWSEAQLRRVQYLQMGDIMYFFHGDVPAYKLVRAGHTDWTLAPVDWQDGPYRAQVEADMDVNLTPGARTGTGIALASSGDLFEAGHVGCHFRLGYTDPADDEVTLWGWGTIASVTNARNATIDIVEPFGEEYTDDPAFDAGILGWSDKSTAPSAISYDGANRRMVLTKDAAGGYAKGEYEVDVTAGKSLSLQVDVAVVNTAVRVYVGTATGGTNVLAVQTLTSTGQHSFTITPQKETIFVTVDNSTGAAGDVDALDSVSLTALELSTNNWREGAWSDVRGYPVTATFFELRLVTAKQRDLSASRAGGDFETFAFNEPTEADDGFSTSVASPRVSEVFWLMDGETLLAGTNSGEMKVTTGVDGEPLSAEEGVKIKRQSAHGSASVPAVIAGEHALFVSKSGKKLREIVYDVTYTRYQSAELTLLAEHITGDGIVALDYASEPDGILWCVLEDGGLAGCTFLPNEQVIAWHRHPIGGDGAVEDVACIPGDGRDEPWFVVRRTVGGATVRYIEFMEAAFDGHGKTDATDAFLVDSGLTGEYASAVTEVSGLDHLEGETVAILADGSVHAGQVVSGGSVALDIPAKVVHVGLPYSSVLQPMRLEVTTNEGTIPDKKRVTEVVGRFLYTVGGEIGDGDDVAANMEKINTFASPPVPGAPPALFSGDKAVNISGGFDADAIVTVRQDAPLPMTIQMLRPNVEAA